MRLTSLNQREMRRKATRLFRSMVSHLGGWMPWSAKIALAKRSSKLGYLLTKDGDFVLPNYLDSFRVNINTLYTTERVMLAGTYEKDLSWAIQKFVGRGETCLDIGANVGAVTLFLARAVGEEGRVICVEPGPVFFQRLRRNIELNPQLERMVEMHNLGLAQQDGHLFWEEDPDFPGNAYMFGKRGTRVEVTTLDKLLGDRLPRLDFIKVDVEGMEFEVLSGAVETIRRFRPKIFMETLMEFECFRNSPVRKAASDLLTGLGYRLYRISNDGGVQPVEYPHFTSNTLALPELLAGK